MRLIVYLFTVTNIILSTSGRSFLPELPFQVATKFGKKELVGAIPPLFSLKHNDGLLVEAESDSDQDQKVFHLTFSGEDVEAILNYTDADGNTATKLLKGTCYFTVSRLTYTEDIEGELVYVLSPESKGRIVTLLQIEGANRSVEGDSLPAKAVLPGAVAALLGQQVCPDIKIITGHAALKYTEKSYILIRRGTKLNLEEKVFSRNDPAFNEMFCIWARHVGSPRGNPGYQLLRSVDDLNSRLTSQTKSKG